MVEQPAVVVRGEAVREVPPELARFAVTVSARDKDRQTALTRLTERAAALRVIIEGYGEVIERRETGGVQLHPELKRLGEKVAAYTGSVTTIVTVSDFTVLGDLLLRLGNQDQTSVAGPWWQLRPGSAAGAEVRQAAVADALDRAREYAAAVGARLDRLVEIVDEGPGGGPVMRAAYSLAGAPAEALELDLDPQQQTVHAAVRMRFTITEPADVG